MNAALASLGCMCTVLYLTDYAPRWVAVLGVVLCFAAMLVSLLRRKARR